MTRVNTALVMLLLLAAAPARADAPLVTYHLEYGGIVGGVADGTVQRDGRATTASTRCDGRTHHFRLRVKQLRQLRADLRHARRHAHPRERDVGGPEASLAEVTSRRLHLRYHGFGSVPRGAEPLVDDLYRIATMRCPNG